MLRKSVALAFVFIWIIASGYDLLQELDLSAQFKIKNAQKASLPGIAKLANLATDNPGNANPTLTPRAEILTASHSTALQLFENADIKPDLKIHKLQRVFLI